MAVGLRRRGNPFGATNFFGYDAQDEDAHARQPMGFEQVAGVGAEEVAPPDEVQPELIQPIEPQSKGEEGFFSRVFGGGDDGGQPSQAQIERRMKLAQSMIDRGQEDGPPGHPLQSIGRAVSQIAGSWMQGKAERQADAAEKSRREALKTALGQGGDIEALADNLLKSNDPAMVDQGLEIKLKIAMAGSKRREKPTIEDFIEGEQTVQKAYDPETGEWKEMGRGPRFARQVPGISLSVGGGGNGGPTSQGVAMSLPDGRIVQAAFAKGRGFLYVDEKGQYVPVPPGSRPVTASTGGNLNASQFLKLKRDRVDSINALKSLEKYFNTVGGLPQGVQRWANSLTANAKTMFGGELSADEFNQLDAGAQVQALLGMFRTTVVGPGVMTEYDAVRILNALGKDPASALQNTQVIGPILQNLYERKRAEAQVMQEEYVRNAPVFGEDPSDLGVADSIGNERPDSVTGAAATQPPPKESRVKGKTYPTPRGPMIWTGTGWRPAS